MLLGLKAKYSFLEFFKYISLYQNPDIVKQLNCEVLLKFHQVNPTANVMSTFLENSSFSMSFSGFSRIISMFGRVRRGKIGEMVKNDGKEGNMGWKKETRKYFT